MREPQNWVSNKVEAPVFFCLYIMPILERRGKRATTMRKSLHIVLATSLLFLFHQNLSAYDFEVDGIYYNITSNSDLTVSVTKNNNTYSGNLIIPNTVCHSGKAYLVTSIEDETFRECSDLTNITLPIGLRSIGYGAFEECKGITNISLPNELLSIGDWVFVGCI